MVTGPPLLDVTDLSVAFHGRRGVVTAVDGVSFRLHEGEALGIVGESGSGKTVTALSVVGLVPTPPAVMGEGSSIRYRGEEMVGASEARLRRLRGGEVGIVFQDPAQALNPVRTVGAQIVETLRLDGPLSWADARERASELLAEFGIAHPARQLDAYPHEFSGGMAQRAALAIAMARNPAVLVADEPTTQLDPTVQGQILRLLRDLRERRNLALLLVSHDLGVVAGSCRRVLVMRRGQMVEDGPVEDVLRSPRHPYTRELLDSRSIALAGG